MRLIKTAEAFNGHIDLLCCNAGILLEGGSEVANDKWQTIWEINVFSHVLAARAALPNMIKRGEGYILNTASAAGLLSQIGSAPYSVTKHAAVGFAESLAIEHGDRGIKVSILSRGQHSYARGYGRRGSCGHRWCHSARRIM
ncbi:MAG: SDR family oxidoreductase [Pseudomonadales bacterium]|nr:SDR family oxidoreductase [Pseudomonadales bacterium]